MSEDKPQTLTEIELEQLYQIHRYGQQTDPLEDDPLCMVCKEWITRCSCSEWVMKLLPRTLATITELKEELEETQSDELLALKNYDKYLTAYEDIASALGEDSNSEVDNLLTKIKSLKKEKMKNLLCSTSGLYHPPTYEQTWIETIPNPQDKIKDPYTQVTSHPVVEKSVKKKYLNLMDLITVIYLGFTSSMFFLTGINKVGWFISAIIPFYLGCRILHEKEKSRTS